MEALIFDCDGVLADTERDGHRVAFNRAFVEAGISRSWDVDLYARLVQISGGKERMRAYFNETGWPVAPQDQDALIARLHTLKTELFMKIITAGELPIRTGISRIVDEAHAAGVKLAVCSTSNEKAVRGVVNRLLGPERESYFAGIFAGDVVSKKKPDPAIYNLAASKLGLNPTACVVVEDSRNGLLAATRAGMMCVITKSTYTGSEKFTEAAAIYPELGDEVSLNDLEKLLKKNT